MTRATAAGCIRQANPASERGFSLVIVLVLLVAMSLLGIAVLRSSAMQERMSANLRDRNLALQAAEAALRAAQAHLAATNSHVGAGSTWDKAQPDATDCSNLGICPMGTRPQDASWRTVSPAYGAGDANVPDTPAEYWIEYVGEAPITAGASDVVGSSAPNTGPMFRITARSRAAGRADVMLQSNVIFRP